MKNKNPVYPKFLTTFIQDFTAAEKDGVEQIKALWKHLFQTNRNNATIFSELVLVLRTKLWEHFHHNENELVDVYDKLLKKSNKFALSHFVNTDLEYYKSVNCQKDE